MAEAIFKQQGGQQDYTPAAAKSGGEVILMPDGRTGIVKSDLAASEKGAIYTSGIVKLTCATGVTFSDGDPVFWDVSAATALTAEGVPGDHYVGTAVGDKAAELFVWVDLNAPSVALATGGYRVPWVTPTIGLAHDDTASYDVVTAAQNPLGLKVLNFWGTVTEAPAGSSEDQLVITLYDEDNNALSTLTTTNTTPDVAGDIVQGAISYGASATGAVACIIPAGKSAYVKVTQATAGTPAGEVDVCAMVVAAV